MPLVTETGRSNAGLLNVSGHRKESVTVERERTMNKDELKGKAEALKGKIKQGAGKLTNDPDLHDEGVADEVAGKTQDALGHARRKVGDAIKDLGKAIKK
jgi:uncharacterized protein YjbJ (UPF0337 family)